MRERKAAKAVLLTLSIVGGLLSVQCANGPATPRSGDPSPIASLSVPLPAEGALAPGTYSLANPAHDDKGNCVMPCSDYRRFIFTLPAGWGTSDGLVYKHLNQPGEVAFSAWSVRDVYNDPCHWQSSGLSPIDIHQSGAIGATGTLVLAPYGGGLANQALRGPRPRALHQETMASVWSEVVGRVLVLRIDLSVPAELDISACDKGEFRSWPVSYNGREVGAADLLANDTGNSHHASGQLDTVYMVDVDRWPLVIDASHMPATSRADLAELDAIVASMTIDLG
jgi:hypothetical protein